METKLNKANIVSKFGKTVKHFVKETGVAEIVNFNVTWPLKVL